MMLRSLLFIAFFIGLISFYAKAQTCSNANTTLQDALLKLSEYTEIFSNSTAISVAGKIANKTNNYTILIDQICGLNNSRDFDYFAFASFVLNFAPSPYKEVLEPYIKFSSDLASAVERLVEDINFSQLENLTAIKKVYIKVYEDGFWIFDKDINPKDYIHLIKYIKLYFFSTSYGISRIEYEPKDLYLEDEYLVALFEDLSGMYGESYKMFIEMNFINGSRVYVPISKDFVRIEAINAYEYKVFITLRSETDNIDNNSNYFIDNLRVVK